MNSAKSSAIFAAISASALLFGGCKVDPVSGYFDKLPSKVAEAPKPETPIVLPPVFVPNGILGGHFDLDTATGDVPFPHGSADVNFHIHQYDKTNQTTTVDFFNMSNKSPNTRKGTQLDQIGTAVPTGKRFYVNVLNGSINPGAVLVLNTTLTRVTNYTSATQQLLASGSKPTAYTLGTPQTGDQKLSTLKVAFDNTVPAASLLVPTSPDECVYPNVLGPKGEYRNGALVVQLVDADRAQLDPNNGAAVQGGGLPWEGIIYNHPMKLDAATGKEVSARTCL